MAAIWSHTAAWAAGRALALTSLEFDLLAHFAAHADAVQSRAVLAVTVWGRQLGQESSNFIDVAVGGSNPGGPVDLPLPAVAPGSVTEQTLNAGTTIAKDNGAMDFIANATGAIYAEAWTPELQKMVGGRQTADGMLKTVQAEYVKELSR